MATILIIEDDPILSQLLQQVLEDEGHQACIAASLSEASEAVRSQPISLVMADLVEFDQRGGAETIRALRMVAAGRPVLLCSGQPEAPRLGDLAGIAGVVSKPFEFETLLERVEAALAGAPLN